VAQAENNKKSKRARVLRATDVIPPFDKEVLPAGEADNGDRTSAPGETEGRPPQDEARVGGALETTSAGSDESQTEQPAAVPEIPMYDLGENILAEHRQAASRRRKAPGQVETETPTRFEHATVTAHVVEPPSQDLAELQLIVAEIVARDIERLCRQPSAPLHE